MITIAAPISDTGGRISCHMTATSTGLRIGSILPMIEAAIAEVYLVPMARQIYAAATWNTPRKMTAVHMTGVNTVSLIRSGVNRIPLTASPISMDENASPSSNVFSMNTPA